MLRMILAVLIAAHGIGHVLFLMPLLGVTESSAWGQSARSWLLTGDTAAKVIGGAIWIVAIVAFCATAYGLWMQQSWWRTTAVIGAIISALGLLLFWANPVSSSTVWALLFNIAVVGALVIVHWPSSEIVGA
ncbi:MAG: hypothetical protein KF726_27345 [Anaerolineae bacterium]|nr:hypothetical protein [Anaerolineae bacterium]